MLDSLILLLRLSVQFNIVAVFIYYIIITTIIHWNSNTGILLVLVRHFQWTMGVSLLLVNWKSVGKVCWTLWSGQKCLDKQQIIIRKILGSNSRKKSILVTQSPMESARKSSGSVKTSVDPPSQANLAGSVHLVGLANPQYQSLRK